MKVEYDAMGSILIQQDATTFSGADEIGRASVVWGPLVLNARRPGTDLNGYSVRLSSGVVELLDPSGILVRQSSRMSGSSIHVAAAINEGFRTVLRASVTAVAPVPPGPAALSGGTDPVVVGGCQFKYGPQADAGLFYYDQPQNYVVTQIEGQFPAILVATPVLVDVINLDEGLEPILDEFSTLYCTQLDPLNPAFTVTDVRCQLLPFRAIRVRCAAGGKIRVQVRREAAAPT